MQEAPWTGQDPLEVGEADEVVVVVVVVADLLRNCVSKLNLGFKDGYAQHMNKLLT